MAFEKCRICCIFTEINHMSRSFVFSAVLACLFFFSACSSKSSKQDFVKDEKLQKELQEQFILVEDGGTIELPSGRFLFAKALSLEGKKNVTIKGKGVDKTILSFLGQTEGAEGINITNCDGITVEGFTIQDAKGDNLKLKGCKNVAIRNMNSTWTTGADTANGNYGYYPVECHNVLLEDCEVSYCADAGVYVGQSTNVIVRRCYAHHNVAGIEIENCINSDIYENKSENNSGGILVFDLPKLFQPNGRNARVYNNQIIANNFDNFGKPGSIVATIPPGSGMIIMATDSVDVFNNNFTDNKTVGCAIVSYLTTGKPVNDSTYGPYCHSVYVHDNTFSRKALLVPALNTDFGKLAMFACKGPIDIVYDGASEKELRDATGMLPEGKKICLRNNGDVRFVNMNAWKAKDLIDVKNTFDKDISKFDCSYTGINGNNTPLPTANNP
jgi:parallel beta-helix repeat protein